MAHQLLFFLAGGCWQTCQERDGLCGRRAQWFCNSYFYVPKSSSLQNYSSYQLLKTAMTMCLRELTLALAFSVKQEDSWTEIWPLALDDVGNPCRPHCFLENSFISPSSTCCPGSWEKSASHCPGRLSWRRKSRVSITSPIRKGQLSFILKYFIYFLF